MCKQAIKDAVKAYEKFFKGLAEYPKYKGRKRSEPKFYADPVKIQFTATHVKLESIAQSKKKNRQSLNWFRLAEHDRIPIGAKYLNPRISFDGLNWFLTVGIETEGQAIVTGNYGIGIDLGVKDLAICSSGHVYRNINKTSRVRRLKKKQRRLQRKISRKYEKNKKGGRYEKTRNIRKSEKQLLRIAHKLTDIIRFMTVDRFYPSSKLCSVCGNVKKDLKLSDRIYHCEHCGAVIDRDMNASINLYQYGQSIINH